ncbi:DNA-binding protein [Dankookia rubra]|nr:DNA-binding protein [Dankookia rubra]
MRPALVTDAEVVEAARRIRARGEDINGWSIRREVGDRGNTRRLLAVWKEQGDAAPPTKAKEDTGNLPAPLLELVAAGRTTLFAELDTIIHAIHHHARKDADATFRRITDELQTSERRIRSELELAEASVDATEHELDRRGDAIAALEAEVGEVRVQIACLTERERRALHHAQEADVQIVNYQAERESFIKAAQIARESQAAAEAQAATLRDEVNHLRATLERIETVRQVEVGRATAELAAARQQIEDARGAHQAQIDAARQQAAAAQAAEHTLRGEQERLLTELAAASTERRQAETTLQAAQREVAGAEQRIAVLAVELAEAGRGRQIAEQRAAALEAERRSGMRHASRTASVPPKAERAVATEEGDTLL